MNTPANPVTLPLAQYAPKHFLLGVTDGVRRSPLNSVHLAANQHCQTLEKRNPRPNPLTVRCDDHVPYLF